MQPDLKLGDNIMYFKNKSKFIIPLTILLTTGCIQGKIPFDRVMAGGAGVVAGSNINSNLNINKSTSGIVSLKEVFDSSVEKIPTLTAVGYAVVSSQPGRTQAQKRLMAIRSSRMSAMRELAEQIHGIQVDSNTTVIDLMVQNDTFRAVVKGVIRGAKTVRINPTGNDTYETVLEIDRDMMMALLRNARRS